MKDAIFFLLQAFLAALFLIVGVALAIEAASGGYGIGLVIVAVMANALKWTNVVGADSNVPCSARLRRLRSLFAIA